MFPPPGLPDGRAVELPGRGTTFVRELTRAPDSSDSSDSPRPTVLLLHGWTANSALNFYASYEPLAQVADVLALDHRGHGNGIRSRDRFTIEDCADDAAALLDVLDPNGDRRVIAVGYSMGGPIAQQLWKRHRARVDGLVLCATAAKFRDGGSERVIGGVVGGMMNGVVSGLSLASRLAPSNWNRRVSERVLVSKYDDTPLGRWAKEQARANDLHSMIEAGHAVGSYDARHWIAEIDVPAAVVLTTRDETVPPRRQEQMAGAIPDAHVVRVDGRHDVCATRPERFNDALLDALSSVTARIGSLTSPGPLGPLGSTH